MREFPPDDRHLMARFRNDIGFEIQIAEDRAPASNMTDQAEPGELRGIPVLAKNVGGAMPRTRPDYEVVRLDKAS